ncbi:ephrin-B1 [Nematostella vectensis]|uniref:ephrin-B1 n=1 Tax=Nematostella vectensis TaxID=45351 RepID=UPI0013903663|nr:ephrin-B1 [Nematostella vectensis]
MSMRVLLMLVLFMVGTSVADFLPTILWNPENPIFENLRNKPRTVLMKDKLTFLCPNLGDYEIQTNTQHSKDHQYASIYMVDEAGYNNCNATGAKKILTCSDPMALKFKTVLIQEIAPTNNIPEFTKGKTYYFIDTSSGTSNTIDSLNGGRCAQNKLKLKIYVCLSESDPNCPATNRVLNGGWSDWGECQSSGVKQRQCNSPSPANGGTPCIGDTTRPCSLLFTTTQHPSKENSTSIPKKEKRSSSPSQLNQLSVGTLAGIFTAIFITGLVVGGVISAFAVHRWNKINRRKAKNAYNRNSVLSTATLRPMSTGSLLY